MSPLARPCLDCGALSDQSRCPAHRPARRPDRRPHRQARRLPAATRALVLARDAAVCAWCGGLATTVDHLVPQALGGDDSPANLVAACRRCNSSRGASVRRRPR